MNDELKKIIERAKANAPVLTSGNQPNCIECEDTGFTTIVDEYGIERTRVCDCEMKRRADRKRARAGFSTSQFDTFIDKEEWQKKLKATAVQYSCHGKGWFFIGGQKGCGKTHLCKAICDKLSEHHDVGYMNYVADIRRLKHDTNEAELDRFKNIEHLYIDDLFKTEPTDTELKIIFEIINHRYENNNSTIISSEKLFSELMEIDEAIASRIREKAGSYMLNVAANENRNYRLRR